MIKGTIKFLDATPNLGITAGVGEDLKSAREIAALEKQGYIFDETLTMTYKAWLAGKRQGDIAADSTFEDWVSNVAEFMVMPSERDLNFAVASGKMTREEADSILDLLRDEISGELQAQPVE